MSFWIAATVDDTCIPLAAADHSYVVVHVYLEGSLSFWSSCRGVQRVVMCQKCVRLEAKPAAYQHLTRASSDGYDSDEEPSFPPWWAEAGEKRASAGDQRRIDRVCCSRSTVEQSLLLLWPFTNSDVEAKALLRTKEPRGPPNFHIWIHKPPQIDHWFCSTLSMLIFFCQRVPLSKLPNRHTSAHVWT